MPFTLAQRLEALVRSGLERLEAAKVVAHDYECEQAAMAVLRERKRCHRTSFHRLRVGQGK